jgi:hypothetical protein
VDKEAVQKKAEGMEGLTKGDLETKETQVTELEEEVEIKVRGV